MKKLLRGKFLPTHYRQDAFIEYHGCKQGDLSVEDFTNEFDRLRMRCDVEEEEEQTIARYFGALRSKISDVVQLQQYFSYENVCRLALKVEKQLKGKKIVNRWSDRESSNFRGSSSSTGSIKPAAPVAAKPQIAAKPMESGPRAQQSVRCFKCQCFGHMQAECPNRQMVTFVGEEETHVFDESGDEGSDSDGNTDTELVYANQGIAIVVRRVLNISTTEDDQWLRHNIFRTKCTTKGKVCNVIIDGGSCENVVSATMIEKLGLKTVDHPQPYKIS